MKSNIKSDCHRIMMRLLIGMFIFVLFLTIVSSTSYYVEVHEGIGAETGDKKQPFPDDEEEEIQEENNITHYHYNKELKNSLKFSDKINIGLNRNIAEKITIENNTNTTDTSEKPQEPINWTPIIVWGIVILIVLFLIGVGWYIYQVYFY